MKKTYLTLTPIALVTTLMMSQAYADHTVLHDVVVTATPMTSPFLIETDPKQPRQPLPAHDGADYLKTIPGFTVMRKGGTDGEAIFRGMAGSRLNILVDDQNVVGGCNMRMDAPTAYIFPEAYDKLTVIKGPQTVEYANMGSAATIKFDREPKKYEKQSSSLFASGLVGSFGRHDEIVQADTGNEKFFAEVVGTNSQQNNYKDGSGNTYHSAYHRWSTNAAVGLTPDNHTRVELSASISDGWAKYADRMMDGRKFLRENVALKAEKKHISELVESIGFQISRNSVDHIMDQTTFRNNMMSGMMAPEARVDHLSTQARLFGIFNLGSKDKLKLGADYSEATHSAETWSCTGGGSAMNNTCAGWSKTAGLTDNSKFKSYGVFGELTHQHNESSKVVSGLRHDWANADFYGSSNKERSDGLTSGFARYEVKYAGNMSSYIGLGHSERSPDYWEVVGSSTATGAWFNSTKKEKTNQLDIGQIYKTDRQIITASVFYNKINDFILLGYSNGMIGSVSNIDAHTYGAELSYSRNVNDQIKIITAISHVRGKDETNNRSLPQLPPLEGRLGVSYDDKKWSAGALARFAASQSRYVANYGNIAGYDLSSPTGGFAVYSLNAGYVVDKKTKINFGVDNIFDKTYAEFISRTGSSGGAPVNPATTRVNEPGRTAWLKATIALD
ncbi:MAG: copper transporter porin [Pseudomonadota bacterium]